MIAITMSISLELSLREVQWVRFFAFFENHLKGLGIGHGLILLNETSARTLVQFIDFKALLVI